MLIVKAKMVKKKKEKKIAGICRVCISTPHYYGTGLGGLKYASWFIYKLEWKLHDALINVV